MAALHEGGTQDARRPRPASCDGLRGKPAGWSHWLAARSITPEAVRSMRKLVARAFASSGYADRTRSTSARADRRGARRGIACADGARPMTWSSPVTPKRDENIAHTRSPEHASKNIRDCVGGLLRNGACRIAFKGARWAATLLCNLNLGSVWRRRVTGAPVGTWLSSPAEVMTAHRLQPTTSVATLLSDLPRLGSAGRALSNSEPMVVKCTCPGREVPFYCAAHGRVENPNWPLLNAKSWSTFRPSEASAPNHSRADCGHRTRTRFQPPINVNPMRHWTYCWSPYLLTARQLLIPNPTKLS